MAFSIPKNSQLDSVRLIGRQGRSRSHQHGHARLAEIIASDVSLLVTFNHASDLVIETNPKPERVTCPQGQVPCRILYALRKDYIKEIRSTPLAPYLTTIPIPICRIILDSVAGVFSR